VAPDRFDGARHALEERDDGGRRRAPDRVDLDRRSESDYSLAYDAAGNLTDDGEDYEYEYDAFYRLRKVRNQSSTLLAEYRYNGLGHMIGVHEDTDADADCDASDVWYYPAYDEGWREVARYRESDTSPKEQFVNATAGLDGYGGSAYINDVVCREKDASTAWTAASDGTLEERYYYCPNWRGDVSALVYTGGYLAEWVKYSPYGIPFGMPGADTDSDGDNDSADYAQIQSWIDAAAYDVRGDVDLDGDIDSADKTLAQGAPIGGDCLGWHSLGSDTLRNRRGHNGHQHLYPGSLYARSRFATAISGRWAGRDPLGYVDFLALYEFAGSKPLSLMDPFGTTTYGWGDWTGSNWCLSHPYHPNCVERPPRRPRKFKCQMTPPCCDKLDECLDCIGKGAAAGNGDCQFFALQAFVWVVGAA
jgi:YD repeat-containing protein